MNNDNSAKTSMQLKAAIVPLMINYFYERCRVSKHVLTFLIADLCVKIEYTE